MVKDKFIFKKATQGINSVKHIKVHHNDNHDKLSIEELRLIKQYLQSSIALEPVENDSIKSDKQ